MLSAFFSGSETGFYRVAPVRLQLDALGGDRIARGLVWLINHPAIFVATTLVGNNLANYMTSLAIVLAMQSIFTKSSGMVGELLAPLILTPVLFVYGELLPKYLFLHAPYRLLRRGAPLFFCFVPLFFVISAGLFVVNGLVAWIIGNSHAKVQLRLARRELSQALEEGHEAGVLRPSQQRLAQGIFAVAGKMVSEYVQPLTQVVQVRSNMPPSMVLEIARQNEVTELLVFESEKKQEGPIGYVRVIDMRLPMDRKTMSRLPVRPLLRIAGDESPIEALLRMESENEELALVYRPDKRRTDVGLVTALHLRDTLLRGAKMAVEAV